MSCLYFQGLLKVVSNYFIWFKTTNEVKVQQPKGYFMLKILKLSEKYAFTQETLVLGNSTQALITSDGLVQQATDN